MKTYDCKVRLAGVVANEVFKAGITAAEIEILRFLHGNDAVADIKAADDNKRDSGAERAYLRAKYASPELFNAEQAKAKQAMMRDLFGHERNPLPETVDDLLKPEDMAPDEVDDTPAPPRRTKIAKPAEPAFTA